MKITLILYSMVICGTKLVPVTIIIKIILNFGIKCGTKLVPVTITMKITLYFYSMVICGTKLVPVTIIIKITKFWSSVSTKLVPVNHYENHSDFYSTVICGTKLVPVTIIIKKTQQFSKYPFVYQYELKRVTMWYQIGPSDHHYENHSVLLCLVFCEYQSSDHHYQDNSVILVSTKLVPVTPL